MSEACTNERNGRCTITNRMCEDYYLGRCRRTWKPKTKAKPDLRKLPTKSR